MNSDGQYASVSTVMDNDGGYASVSSAIEDGSHALTVVTVCTKFIFERDYY
jgi:hypothetical protein